jgi:phosphoribosylformylglycinamidine synthase
LAVALAECCATAPETGPDGPLGARVVLDGAMRPDALLFGESASRIVLGVRAEAVGQVQAIARRHGAPCAALGTVGGDVLVVQGPGVALRVAVSALRERWRTGLEQLLQSP